jgi:HK97 family phage portal protein
VPQVPNKALTILGQRESPGGLGRFLSRKQTTFDVPGQQAGWRGVGGGGGSLRSFFSQSGIRDYLGTYGGTDESIVWVYACVSLIASEGASYPWEVATDQAEILADNEVPNELKALLDKPNPRMTYFDFTEFVYTDLELAGNSYWLKDNMTRGGRPERLMRLRPDLVEIVPSATGEPFGYLYTAGSTRVPFDLNEVIHFKYPSPTDGDFYGMGTVEAIQRELGMDLDETQHISGFFKSGARISGILTTADVLNEDQWQRLKTDFEQEFGVRGANRFGILIAEQGTGYTPINVAPAGSGVIELKQMGKDAILSAFGVPEFLLGGSGQGGVYRMSEAQFIFGRSMKPKAIRFMERMEQDLIRPGWNLNFLVDTRYAEPPDVKIERAGAMLGKGSSLNQLLDAQDLPPIDHPVADEPIIQLGYLPWSMAMQQAGAQVRSAEAAAAAAEQSNAGGGGFGGMAPNANGGGNFYNGLDGTSESGGGGALGPGGAGFGSDLTSYLGPNGGSGFDPAAQNGNGRDSSGGTSNFYGGLSAPEPEVLLQSPRPRSRHPQAPRQIPMTSGTKAITAAPEPMADFPRGFEQRGEIKATHTDQEIADAVIRHQGKVYRENVDLVQREMVKFFQEQRKRVIGKLSHKGVTKNVLIDRKADESGQQPAPKRQINMDRLWSQNVEDAALLQTYLPLVDDIAAQAVTVSRIAGSGLDWNLQNPAVRTVRQLLAQKVTRINETTREKLATVIEEGMRRGYSIPQIANGHQDNDGYYQGVQGVFDEATAARAETIARTETAVVYNQAAIVGYKDGGVEHVEVFDGNHDPECAAANGQRWTLEKAAENPIAHPNCIRSFAPVVGGKGVHRANLDAFDRLSLVKATEIVRNHKPFPQTETYTRAWKSTIYVQDHSYGDRLMADLAYEYGFNQPPDQMPEAALTVYAKRGEREIFIGGSLEQISDLLDGDPFYESGVTGNGVIAMRNVRAARERAGTRGAIVRATIKSDARVADLAFVESQVREDWDTYVPFAEKGDPRAIAMIGIAKNPGRWAMTQGFDALYDDRHDQFIVFNLTALRVQDKLIPPAGE